MFKKYLPISFCAVAGLCFACVASSEEPARRIVCFDLGKLDDLISQRDSVTTMAERDVKNHKLDASYIAKVLAELDDYQLLAIDTLETKILDGEQSVEFANGGVPRLVLHRRSGEGLRKNDDPTLDEPTPLIAASFELVKPFEASKSVKYVNVQFIIHGLPGPGWRASEQESRWKVYGSKLIQLKPNQQQVPVQAKSPK